MQKNLKTNISKCSGCGDDMTFHPSKQCLVCPSCNLEKEITAPVGLLKRDLDLTETFSDHKNSDWLKQNHAMQCPNCGATSILSNYETSAMCPYCDTSLIACKKQFNSLKPDSIVPFKFGKDRAEQLFKEKLKNKWFISGKFKKSIRADEIIAYYFPAFVFDADCSTIYSGRLYNEETKNKSDGTSETVRNYFNISGQKETHHANIEIEASAKLSQFELNSIRPYNLNEARSYSNEFIYGFSLEQYSNSILETHKQAQKLMEQDIRKEILKCYRHDGVSYLNMTPSFYNQKYSYCMLPIYRFNFSYKNNKYTNVMNGQTGSLGGDYPKSVGKISLIVILGLLIFFLPIVLFVLFAIF